MTRWFLNIAVVLICSTSVLAQPDQCLVDRYGEVEVFLEEQILVDTDVLYGSAVNIASGVEQDLLMDVYYPDPAIDEVEERPVIFLLHGGSFMAGNKADLAAKCMDFAQRGYVAVSIGYRLGWGCSGTDFLQICVICGGMQYTLRGAVYSAVQDARAAIRYGLDNASDYGIDPDWLFVGGESAGAITALHTTFWDQGYADAFAPGVVDDLGLLDESGNDIELEYTIHGVVNHCGAVSDINAVSDAPRPVISFHDEADCVVPYNCGPVIGCLCSTFFSVCGSSQIHTNLINNGMCSELHTVALSLNHCSFPSLQLVMKSSCFMKRVMCGVCTSSSNTDPYALSSCSSLMSVDTGTSGCTYPNAINWNPLAVIDDGSCEFDLEATCPLDLDGDNLVNTADLLIFLSGFGTICE